MEQFHIRVCTPNDIDGVIALERQWEQEDIAYGDFNPMSREAYVAILKHFPAYFLVAESDGQRLPAKPPASNLLTSRWEHVRVVSGFPPNMAFPRARQKYGYAPKPEDYEAGGVHVFYPRVVFAWRPPLKDATRWELPPDGIA